VGTPEITDSCCSPAWHPPQVVSGGEKITLAKGALACSGVSTGKVISALSERKSGRCSPNSSSGAPSPSGTTDITFGSSNKKMRGLRGPRAGCALNKLLVALISSGRASDSKKQGKLSGFGSALINVTVSSIVCGELDTPAGARQPAVGLRPVGGGGSFCGESPQPTLLSASSHAPQIERKRKPRGTRTTSAV